LQVDIASAGDISLPEFLKLARDLELDILMPIIIPIMMELEYS